MRWVFLGCWQIRSVPRQPRRQRTLSGHGKQDADTTARHDGRGAEAGPHQGIADSGGERRRGAAAESSALPWREDVADPTHPALDRERQPASRSPDRAVRRRRNRLPDSGHGRVGGAVPHGRTGPRRGGFLARGAEPRSSVV